MTLATVDLYRYRLPFTSSLQVGGRTLERRPGLLIRLGNAVGDTGWGDAAPLPGFSPETLGEVVSHAQSLQNSLLGAPLTRNESLDAMLRALPLGDTCPASLRFAIETAVIELLASAKDRAVASLLGSPRRTISLNALLSNPLQDGVKRATELRDAGYEAVKVKVGRAPVGEEADCVRTLSRVLGDEVELRLDANRAWTFEQAVAFSQNIPPGSVAYIEEPLANPAQLSALGTQTGHAIALDETTRDRGPDVLEEMESVEAVVLKPTLLGGIAVTREWARRAQQVGSLPVVSTTYESGVGLRMLGALAATFPATPVGLSTYDKLAEDVLTPRLPLDSPSVELNALWAEGSDVDSSLLESLPEPS